MAVRKDLSANTTSAAGSTATNQPAPTGSGRTGSTGSASGALSIRASVAGLVASSLFALLALA
jgi:hypothetical protein